MSSGRISVFIGRLPEMKMTDPYSPMARAKARVKPVISAGTSSGRTTRRKTVQRPAPSVAAASSISAPRSSITGCKRAHHEGKADEGERDEDAERTVGRAWMPHCRRATGLQSDPVRLQAADQIGA